MKDIEAAFVGRVGTDTIELRTSAGGKSWASFSVVVGDRDEAQWIMVAVFGERAAQLAGHLKKGARVYVEGRLKLESWTSKSGEARIGLNVAAWRVEQLGQIGKNKPAMPKAPPEGEQPAPPSTVRQHDWQRPPSAEIPF